MTYEIIYNHEVIDCCNNKETASKLVDEYRLAFKTYCVFYRIKYEG